MEEELERDITCAKFAHIGSDGDQEYEYTFRLLFCKQICIRCKQITENFWKFYL